MIILLTAAATGAAAAALTPWTRRVARTDPASLRAGAHVLLAAVAGAGAAALAHGWAELVAFAALAVACALLVVIDVAEFRLPDAIVYPMYPILFAGLALAAVTGAGRGSLGRAAAGAVVLGLGYLLLAVVTPSGLGLGDVKLSGLLGAFLGWFGWSHLLLGTLAAFVLGGVVALGLLVSRRADRHSSVAFGPWMIAGAAAGAAWGPVLVGVPG